MKVTGAQVVAQPVVASLVVPGYLEGFEDRLKRAYSCPRKEDGESQIVWETTGSF